MGSTRLPGKVLSPVLGRPMLAVLLSRLQRARTVQKLIVATTDLPVDASIVGVATDCGATCFRGSENDVLDRYYQAALPEAPDLVVRLTADNPFVDGEFVDAAVEAFLDSGADFTDTSLSRTYPLGLAAEVFTMSALESAWREDTDPATREHVTVFIAARPERFRQLRIAHETDLSRMRWTVDTLEDLTFVRRVFDHFGDEKFSWREILPVLADHPEWVEINQHVPQRGAPKP